MKKSFYQKMKNRRLRVETLEERCLMAVWSGLDGAVSSEASLVSAPSEVVVDSPIDIDGDGFIGPGDRSFLSAAWLSSQEDVQWNAACDIDGDGRVGPGDRTLLSASWFMKTIDLPDEWKEYRITPTNISTWETTGAAVTAVNNVLKLDAQHESQIAVCPFDSFGDDLCVSVEFSTAPLSGGMQGGFCVAVQDSGACYYVEIQSNLISLYYRDADQNEIQLSQISDRTFVYGMWYRVWLQLKDGTLSFGLRDKTLVSVLDNRLSGGRVGFYADRGVASFRNMTVDPSPADAVSEPTMSNVVVSRGTIIDNYVAFPDVCRLADGRLLAVYYVGYTHVSVPTSGHPTGGWVGCSFSSDEGQTWTAIQKVVDTPLDDRDPSIVQLSDGRLLCNFFTLSDGNVEVLTVESSDDGLTWSSPIPVYSGYVTSSPVRILSNGNLIMPLYRQADGTAWGAVGISQDNGKTWLNPIAIPRGPYRLDAETDILELSDGTLYAIQREQMAYSISTDGGWTWSTSKDVGFFGHSPYLLRTSEGIVIMGLRDKNNATVYDTSIRLSGDECQTWGESIMVDSYRGAYPSMVELNDGSILIVYYEEGDGSNVRAKRFSINDDLTVTWELL